MEYIDCTYKKWTNTDCFPAQVYEFETYTWGDLQEKFDLTSEQVQSFLDRRKDKLIVTEFEMRMYDFILANFIGHYVD